MAYFNVCPNCGVNLDPGERCDCRERAERERKEAEQLLVQEKATGQLAFKLNHEGSKAWGWK